MTRGEPARLADRPVTDLLRRVEELRRERPQDARDLLLREFRVTSRRANSAGRGELWRTRGHVLRDTNRMREAATSYRRARQAFQRAGEPSEAASCMHGLLDALMYDGDYEAALRTAATGVSELRALGEKAGLARLLNNQANLLHRLDRHAQALALYAEARAALSRDPFSRAVVDVNIANCLSSIGRCGPARRKYVSAGRTFEARGMALRALNARYNLAYMDYLEHRHERALDGLARVREEAETLGSASLVALSALDRAEILLRLGADFEAASEARVAIQALTPLDLRYEAAKAHVLAALAEFHLGRVQSARAELERALHDFVAERNDVWIGETLVGLATIWRQEGAPDAATALLAVARGRFARSGDVERAACAGALLARAYIDTGNALQAERTLRSIRAAVAGGSPRLRHLAWAAEAQLAGMRGDRRAAARWLESAARESERLASRILDEQWRSSFWGEWGWPHRALAALELAAGRPRRAFEALERGRGRALLAPLSGREAADTKGAEAVREWAATRRSSDRTVRSWAVPAAPAATRPVALALGARLRGRPEAGPSARQVQRALAPSAMLVDYMVHDGWYSALRVTAAGVDAKQRLASERHIASLVDAVVFALRSAALTPRAERTMSAALQNAFAELASLLVWPCVRTAPGGERQPLAIMPAGTLNRIPWPALPLPDGRPLCAIADLAILPGLRLSRLASEARPAPLARPLIVTCGAGDPDGAEEETAAILALFPDAEHLDADAATIAQVREASRHAAWIHIAGHGGFSAASPGQAGLHLADGWLTVDALRTFHTRASWVALSACQTARALIRPGEEWYGLARGFLAAGAGSVMAAQWDVEGWSAAALMHSVYRRIAAGEPLVRALARAQADSARAGEHPFHWAAFSVLGAPSEVLSWSSHGRIRR